MPDERVGKVVFGNTKNSRHEFYLENRSAQLVETASNSAHRLSEQAPDPADCQHRAAGQSRRGVTGYLIR